MPFQRTEIEAPPPTRAESGRANRQGVSFLYVATSIETAVAEVRPHPGHRLSVCGFRAVSDLRIADFGQLCLRDYASSDQELDVFHLAISIDKAMSFPVTPEERHRFSVTQLIADLLRKNGYDGIRYRSSVGLGSNLCIFSPPKLSTIEGNARVIFVCGLAYKTEEVPHVTRSDNLFRTDS